MKKLLLLTFLIFFGRCFGIILTVGYVADSALGTGSGVDAANAASMANHNANTIPSGTITSGTACTIHFVGTIATTSVIPVSGTAGNLITYIFETGAKFSKGNWFQSGTNGDAAIYKTGKSYITIDGNNVGIIECTGNGTPPAATQTDCIGIWSEGVTTGCTVKNLTIQNIYVRTQGTENNAYGNCMKFNNASGSTVLVDNCIVNNAGSLIYFPYGSSLTGLEIKNITGGVNGIGSVVLGDITNGSLLNGALIHDCTFTASLAWAGQPAIHKNLVFCFSDGASSRIDGLKVYNNKFTGFMADNSTSFLFLEGYIYSPILYCNVFAPSTNDFTGNGYIVIKGTQNCVIGNNTFYGATDGISVGTTAWGALQTGLVIKNNVSFNTATGVGDNGPPTYWSQTGASYDYNVYFPSTMNFLAGTGFDTFAQYKTEIASQISGGVGGETHSTQSTPNLNGSYYPVATSSAIGTGSNFADMSAYYTTDKSGVAWAGGTGWGGGALKALASGAGGSSFSGNITLSGKITVQ